MYAGETGLRMKESAFRHHLDGILTYIEQLHVENAFGGSTARLVELFDHYRLDRDDNSVLLWLGYRSELLHPAHGMRCRNLQRTRLRCCAEWRPLAQWDTGP